jgi:hypothetical protein
MDSYVELIFVSDRLAGLKPWERYSLLRELAPRDTASITGYTREEFKALEAFRAELLDAEPLMRLMRRS